MGLIISMQGWIYIGLALLASTGWIYGHYESSKYDTFKAKVMAEGIAAKAIADKTDAWNKQVIKETNDAYQKRLAAIDTKYGRLHQYSDSNPMPTTNTKADPSRAAATPADNVSLERDCAITTNMLVSLQDIVKGSQ